MSICRTCLKTPARKDISKLGNDLSEDYTNHLDIMLFCLNIKVNSDSSITTKLCLNCYRRIKSFYKFKQLSLKNDAYLKSLQPKPIKEEKIDGFVDTIEIEIENCSVPAEMDGLETSTSEVKKNIKEETIKNQSDDEMLSTIKIEKYGSITESTNETKESEVVRTKHHKLVLPEAAALPYDCLPCGRRFVSQGALELHMTTHTTEKPHECDVCQKTFRDKIYVLYHKRQVHNQEKLYNCQLCSKSFFRKYNLQLHEKSHTVNKSYECPDCLQLFPSRDDLKTHSFTHSDVSFSCQHCDTSFAKRSYLKKHMVIHSRERRFPCGYCGLLFARADHRKRHERNTHQKKVSAS